MAATFGTSGLRGPASDLDDATVAAWGVAFRTACPTQGALLVGRDLRDSSERIARAVMATGPSVDCGPLPTPALALAAMQRGCAAVMVTGSHLAADRNGLKFYLPDGEITKEDEANIAGIVTKIDVFSPRPSAAPDPAARNAYIARYVDAFGPGALAGLRLGLFAHSSVATAPVERILTALGADIRLLGHSETFCAVDTEAIDTRTATRLADWVSTHRLDALLSTDPDGDRPLMVDGTGRMVPGDLLGLLTARALGAAHVVTPVSAVTAIELSGAFARVTRTRIGSPYVIAAMDGPDCAGFEPNGGFLLGFDAAGPAGPLPRLPTRDAVLPMLVPLAEMRRTGTTLAAMLDALPPRHSAAGKLRDVSTGDAAALIAGLMDDPVEQAAFYGETVTHTDQMDGLRVTLRTGDIIHLRPSGNAPELRCYAESNSPRAARDLVATTLERLRVRLMRRL